MTQFEGQPQQQQSAFNQRADTAALNLKDQLGREISARTGQQVVLPPSPVPVNEDGNPVGAPPPEGSYARMQYDQYQRQVAQQPQPAPGPTQTTQQVPSPDPSQQQHEPVSDRAQERISTLVSQLRQKDQDYQQQQAQFSQQATTIEELRAELSAQKNLMHQMLEQNLENLDPETRAQVMTDARVRQAVAESEQRILRAVGPQLKSLQDRNSQLERSDLSKTYSGYDPAVHDVLIDEFRRGNPNCSVEQAFRAVATPEELRVGGPRPANVPPPAIPPGHGVQAPRYMPQPQNQQDPMEQIRADAARAAELARSADPADQKAAQALFKKNLADRLGFTS